MIAAALHVLGEVVPTPPPDFDLTSVTPGWVGFTAMFLVAAVTVLLLLDMVRRVRRTRYRGEIQDLLEAERQAADLPGADLSGTTDLPETTGAEPGLKSPKSTSPTPKVGD